MDKVKGKNSKKEQTLKDAIIDLYLNVKIRSNEEVYLNII